MSKAPYLLFNVIYSLISRQEKAQDSVINNCTTQLVTMVSKMHSIKCQWETAHKKQLMISRSQEKHKTNTVSSLIRDTLKQLSQAF